MELKKLNLSELEQMKVGDELKIEYSHSESFVKIIYKGVNKHNRIKYKFSDDTQLTINSSINKEGVLHYHSSGTNFTKIFYLIKK